MKKKINSKFMLISAIAIIVMAICAMVLFYDILKKQIFDDLKANAHVISMMNPEDLPDEINYNLNKDGLRITLINEDGTVIYDSMEDESKMENHRERPEIASALAAGEGRAMRKSTTSAKHTFYYAMRTDDGKVLRIGKDSNSIYSLIIKMVYLTLSVGFCVFVLCTVLAHRLTRRLVAPIEKMADNIVLLEENDVYDEMKPFVATIKQQHVDILKHSQMRQEFTANVSHELKTPLTSISGNADTLLHSYDMLDEQTRKQIFTDIHDDAQWLTELVENLLSITKIADGSVKLRLSDQVVDDIVSEALRHIDRRSTEHHITVDCGDVPLLIRVDAGLIVQVLINLVNNAVKYTTAGSNICITAIQQKKAVEICVSDNGPGIPDELKERVFEMFFAGGNPIGDSRRSLGLGLTLCQAIIHAHHGEITLKNNSPHGCIFSFTLPLSEVNLNE